MAGPRLRTTRKGRLGQPCRSGASRAANGAFPNARSGRGGREIGSRQRLRRPRDGLLKARNRLGDSRKACNSRQKQAPASAAARQKGNLNERPSSSERPRGRRRGEGEQRDKGGFGIVQPAGAGSTAARSEPAPVSCPSVRAAGAARAVCGHRRVRLRGRNWCVGLRRGCDLK